MDWIFDEGKEEIEYPYDDDVCPALGALDAEKIALVEELQQASVEDGGGELDRCLLLRFLRARDFKVEAAHEMLVKAIKWKQSLEPMNELQARKWELYQKTRHVFIGDNDKYGRPVLWICTRRMNPHAWILDPLSDNTTGIAQVMDELWERCRKSHYGKAVIVFNLYGFGMKHSNIPFIRSLVPVVQEYYPDMVSKFLCVDSPWIVYGLARMVLPFLDRATQDKVKFVNHDTLKLYCEDAVIPTELEGTWEEEQLQTEDMWDLPPE